MSQKRPWHTALSSLVVSLTTDETLAANTILEISANECITAEKAANNFLPVVIEAVDARPIHQWLESLPGVHYVDVVFCSTEIPQEEPTSPLTS